MIGLMQLGVGPGQQVQVRATGSDAADAVAALEHLVATNFAEQP
jgi:phosphotransferase system HPr-like phosphotransfer protein